jgi:hypothetical protein
MPAGRRITQRRIVGVPADNRRGGRDACARQQHKGGQSCCEVTHFRPLAGTNALRSRPEFYRRRADESIIANPALCLKL